MNKQLTRIFFFALVVASMVSGCNNSDDDNPQPADGQLTVMIDGQQFTAQGEDVAAIFFNGDFNITARNTTTGEQLTITVQDASVGTFDLGENNGSNASAYNINGDDAFISHGEGGSGQITITTLDEENLLASGTFEMVLTRQFFDTTGEIVTETVTMTEGRFQNIPLVIDIVGAGNSTLSADVDGAAMNPDAVTAIQVSLGGNTSIGISATNSTTLQNIGISLPADIEVGTYDFDSLPLPGSIIGQYSPELGSGSTQFVSIDGTITISAYDPVAGTMEGTFEFTAGDFLGQDPTTYQITNGSFSVEIVD